MQEIKYKSRDTKKAEHSHNISSTEARPRACQPYEDKDRGIRQDYVQKTQSHWIQFTLMVGNKRFYLVGFGRNCRKL